MLWKLLLIAGAVLFVTKLFFRTRFREWGQKLDRFVDITLLAILVVYGGYFVWSLITAGVAS